MNYSILKGSDEKPGLATLAIAEILSMAEQWEFGYYIFLWGLSGACVWSFGSKTANSFYIGR